LIIIIVINCSKSGDFEQRVSNVQWSTFGKNGFKHSLLTNKKGTIYNSGKDNHTVVHETLHLFGLADRYDDYRNASFAMDKNTIPFEGFETNFMGGDGTNLHLIQYTKWIEHAMSRSKANKSIKRVFGTLVVDQKGDFIDMPDGSTRAQKKF